jgi:pyruvate,water dikinase
MRVVYRCEDGSDFPVEWDHPADADSTWFSEREHISRPFVPFEAASVPSHLVPATTRAFSAVGLGLPAMLDFRTKVANGWAYLALPHDVRPRMDAYWGSAAALSARTGGPPAVWERLCVPRIKELTDALASAHDRSPSDELASWQAETWGYTMVAIVTTFVPLFGLIGFLAEHFGPEGERLAGLLTAGYPNATVEADEALWQLAQAAKRSPDVMRVVAAGPPFDMAALPQGGEFAEALARYMAVYGERPDHWQLSAPTLVEHPEQALATIAQTVATNTPSPLASLRHAGGARQHLLDDLAARLGDATKADALRGLVAAAACYSPVREGRAYWQLISWGRLRLALLRIGARLAREQRVGQAEDVLFLEPSEIDGDTGVDFRERVAMRREAWLRASRVAAPLTIGAPGPPDIVSALGPVMPERPAAVNQLRGAAASSGRLRGRARLITSPEDGKRLQPGDVMVCTLTAPPWTPLFGVVGALVTETGGVLSHPSIVAREYGIPCVVGVRNAMRKIREGQFVTVDGDQGLVTLEE